MSETATPVAAPSAQLTCPSCQQNITYYDVEGSEYYACPHCHSYFQYRGEGPPKVFGKYKKVPADLGLLPVGTPGTLAGHACRVVGYVRRAEARHPQYEWTEYQLFRPATCDYVQLAQYHGHWMVIEPAGRNYDVQAAQTRLAYVSQPDAQYKLYNRYQVRVCFAEGEFDWDIEGDDQTQVNEFICPPTMLVQEKAKAGNQWYRAEHVEPAAVAAAFGLQPGNLPRRVGVGAVQPDPIDAVWAGLRTVALLAVCLLCITQFVLKDSSNVLLRTEVHVVADSTGAPGTGKVMVSPSFTLDHTAPVLVELTASLSNQWLELPVSLVNEQTGQGFEFTKNIEFYNGVEDGESWSEGGREADAVLSRVPAGPYHLNFYPFTEAGVAPNIAVVVTADPPLWSNFYLVLVLVLAYPAFRLWRSNNYSTRRWSESDYGPTTE
jgi:hypothetical protein